MKLGMGRGVCKRVAFVVFLSVLGAPASASADSAVVGGVQTMVGGVGYSLAIKGNGSLWAWGNNSDGQLGDGTRTTRKTPVNVLNNVVTVATGLGYVLAVAKDTTLWAWGDNWAGQLGDRTKESRLAPVPAMAGVVTVAAGWSHSLAVTTEDKLLAFGCLGEEENLEPIEIMAGVRSVAAAADHSLIVKTDGTLWAFGNNEYGQLGDGTTDDASKEAPVPVVMDDEVVAVAAGWEHSLAILSDGSLWAWGRNNVGQLGDGSAVDRLEPVKVIAGGVTAVSAGEASSFAVLGDGSLWAWGDNYYGQLGTGTKVNQIEPVEVNSGVKSVAAGVAHALMVKDDGMLWSWGFNSGGQLGDSTTTSRLSPVRVMQTGADAVTGVRVLPTTLYLVAGKSASLRAEVYPYSAGLKDVTWTSANTSVVKVDASGKVTAKKVAGKSTTVTVMTVDGKYVAKCKVVVVKKAAKLKSFKVPGSGTTGLVVEQTMTVKPTSVKPAKATGVVATFASSDAGVAVVDKAGVVTALSPGKTTITVKAGGKTKKFVLTVGTVAPTKITLDVSKVTVARGKKVTLEVVEWLPFDADPQTVTWKTSSKKIATVNSEGVVTGKKKGKATITAVTWNGKTVKCVVTVK